MGVGFHGTHLNFSSIITPTTARPSCGMADWLGYGFYLYSTRHSNEMFAASAFYDAREFAAAKYGSATTVLRAEFDDTYLLDLQHRAIHGPSHRFMMALDRRLERLGVRIDPGSPQYRPLLQLRVDAFRILVESLSGRPIDVVCAQFRDSTVSARQEIDVRRALEICVKRPRALLGFAPAQEPESAEMLEMGPGSFHSDLYAQGAEQAADVITRGRDEFIVDLVMRALEAPYRDWSGQIVRFSRAKRRVLWNVVMGDQPFNISLAQMPNLPNAEIEMHLLRWNKVKCSRTAWECYLDRLDEADALIFRVRAACPHFSLALQEAVSRRKPTVILYDNDDHIPLSMRAVPGVMLIQVPDSLYEEGVPEWADPIIRGLLEDIVRDEAKLTLSLAARDGERSDMPKVIEAYRSSSSQSALFGGVRLDSLPLAVCPEQSANTIRKYVELSSAGGLSQDGPINIREFISIIEDIKLLEIDIEADGYLVLPGELGREGAIILKSGKVIYTRQRFTLAHEVGHIVHRAIFAERVADEEEWCDHFAAALLMPSHRIVKHFRDGATVAELGKRYKVSLAAMRKRLLELLGPEDPDVRDRLNAA